MALPVTIPNTFANATASIPLSQLDTNFTTLANAVNGISSGSETLANVTATVVNATTVDTTNIEVTNIKAKDGTAAGSIADSTGVVTLASSVLTTTDINGGTIDATAIGGSTAAAGSFTTLNTSGQVVFNDAGADVDFRVEGDTEANLLFVDASTDRVGIGTSSPVARLDVVSSSTPTIRIDDNAGSGTRVAGRLFLGNTAGDLGVSIENSVNTFNDNCSMVFKTTAPSGSITPRMTLDSSGRLLVGATSSIGTAAIAAVQSKTGFSCSTTNAEVSGLFTTNSNADNSLFIGADQDNLRAGSYIAFGVDASEKARIDSSGNFFVNKTTTTTNGAGGYLAASGELTATVLGSIVAVFRRDTNDGDIVAFSQDGLTEGTISVSGGTVSYNPFLGSHAGALADWSRPDIKIGTVMDTIDELLEYKVVVIDVQEEVPAKEAVLDEEGNEVEPAQEATTQTVQKRISYNGNGAIGSTATVEYEGEEYTGIIHNEREEPLSFNKHLKVKVNDTAASKAVFGVFVGWNNDSNNDGGVYNDMLVGAVGNYVIRMAAGQEPQIGDLVEADGNGCAVVQDDDIIRTKTIAKVTSTIKQVTYDDGSFLVTCVLYCG